MHDDRIWSPVVHDGCWGHMHTTWFIFFSPLSCSSSPIPLSSSAFLLPRTTRLKSIYRVANNNNNKNQPTNQTNTKHFFLSTCVQMVCVPFRSSIHKCFIVVCFYYLFIQMYSTYPSMHTNTNLFLSLPYSVSLSISTSLFLSMLFSLVPIQVPFPWLFVLNYFSIEKQNK